MIYIFNIKKKEKSKKKRKNNMLDIGLLAEAISIFSDKIDLEKMKHSKKNNYPRDSIQLDEHLTIRINSAWYTNDCGVSMGFCYNLNYFILIITIYVDEIQMATYDLELDIENNKELYRRWECDKKEILHDMPNQFIDLMNEWSKQIVSEFDEKRNRKKEEKKLNKKKKYDYEESILSKYR